MIEGNVLALISWCIFVAIILVFFKYKKLRFYLIASGPSICCQLVGEDGLKIEACNEYQIGYNKYAWVKVSKILLYKKFNDEKRWNIAIKKNKKRS